MRRALFRLSAVAIAGIVALMLAEVAVRVLAPQQLAGSWLTDSGHGYDVNRPGAVASHTFGNRTAHYRINAGGFRGGPIAPAQANVLVVGDSVTFGWLLEENKSYVAELADRATQTFGPGKIQFLNGAVAGWGAAEYLAFLEDHQASLLPMHAVLVFLSGDEARRATEAGLWSLDGDRLVRLEKTRADRPLRSLNGVPGYTFLIEHSHLVNLARRVVVQRLAGRATATTSSQAIPQVAERQLHDAAGLTTALMRELARWCNARRVPLWVVATGYVNLHWDGPGHDINRQFIAEAPRLFESLGVKYLDLVSTLSPVFDAESTYFIPIDYHPNENGARLVTDSSWPWLNARLHEIVK
jgi:lysophospholipase L1-like esterase